MRFRVALALVVAGVTASAALAHGSPQLPPLGDSPGYAPEIMAAARRDVLALRECYDRAPRGSWRVIRTVTLVLDGAGSVVDLRIGPASAPARVFRNCMLPVVRSWRVPAPATRAPFSLEYPAAEIREAVEQLAR